MAKAKKDNKKKKFSEHDPEKYINLEPKSDDTFNEARKLMSFLEYTRETKK